MVHDSLKLLEKRCDDFAVEIKLEMGSDASDSNYSVVLDAIAGRLCSGSSTANLLQRALSLHIARQVRSKINSYLEFHQALLEGGFDPDNWRQCGSNGAACLLFDLGDFDSDRRGGLPEEEDSHVRKPKTIRFSAPAPKQIKAFAVKTTNGNYVVVLSQNSHGWSIHVRQYWESYERMYGIRGGAKAAGRDDTQQPGTIEWAVGFAARVQRYSDDIPGVHAARRPSLRSITDGNFIVGSADAGIALRNGDSRDAGFILSYMERATQDYPELESPSWHEPRLVENALLAIDGAASYSDMPF